MIRLLSQHASFCSFTQTSASSNDVITFLTAAKVASLGADVMPWTLTNVKNLLEYVRTGQIALTLMARTHALAQLHTREETAQ